jgi:tetratricopeptide (TPR) repeat protein
VIQSYQRAVELDPNFAVAYARLANAHARLYFLRHDLSKERLASAAQAANQAEALAPDSPEVLLSLGYYYLWAHRDTEQALIKWTLAEKMMRKPLNLLRRPFN